jgi:hypothetical protein
LARIKRASRNAQVTVIVCGPAFDDHPELLALIGADACARDAGESVMLAESSIERRVRTL